VFARAAPNVEAAPATVIAAEAAGLCGGAGLAVARGELSVVSAPAIATGQFRESVLGVKAPAASGVKFSELTALLLPALRTVVDEAAVADAVPGPVTDTALGVGVCMPVAEEGVGACASSTGTIGIVRAGALCLDGADTRAGAAGAIGFRPTPTEVMSLYSV